MLKLNLPVIPRSLSFVSSFLEKQKLNGIVNAYKRNHMISSHHMISSTFKVYTLNLEVADTNTIDVKACTLNSFSLFFWSISLFFGVLLFYFNHLRNIAYRILGHICRFQQNFYSTNHFKHASGSFENFPDPLGTVTWPRPNTLWA